MEQIKVLYDETGNTLTVWLDDPSQEYSCEETGEEVVLMKNKDGKVIGFEKLNFSQQHSKHVHLAFETIAA